MQAGALKRRNQRAARASASSARSRRAINSIKRAEHVDLRAARPLHRDQVGDPRALRLLLAPGDRSPTDPLDEVDYIGARSPDPAARGRRTSSRPDRAVLRRPAALPAQPEPHRHHRRPRRPDNDSIAVRQRVLRHPGRRHRPRASTVVPSTTSSPSSTAIRADRAGGVYLRNFTVQQAEFNAVYVMETDGFVLDRLIARGNDEYGILAFASDHGLIQHSDAYYNGDSGIYPGSASDVNGDNDEVRSRRATPSRSATTAATTTRSATPARPATRCTRTTTGSTRTPPASRPTRSSPGHPGLPQDHARWNHNKIYSQQRQLLHASTSTRASARSRCGARLHQRHGLPGRPGPGRHRGADRRRQLQLHRPQPDLRQLALRHHAVLGAGAAARRVRPAQAVRHLARQPHLRQRDGHHAHGAIAAQRHGPLVGRRGRRQLLGGQHLLARQSRRTTSPSQPPSLRRRRLGPHPRRCAVKDAGFLSLHRSTTATTRHFRHPPECNWFDSPPKPTDATGTSTGPLGLTAAATDPRSGGVDLLTFGIGVLALGGLAAGRRRKAVVKRRLVTLALALLVVAGGAGVAVRQRPARPVARPARPACRAPRRRRCSRSPTGPSGRSATGTRAR